MEKQKEKFEAGWSQGPGSCGGGSQEQYSVPDTNEAIMFIEEWRGKPKVNEAGCGDMEWLRFTYGYWRAAVDYVGYDITPRAGRPELKFGGVLDITAEVMRPCDIVLCRTVFIHLPNESIAAALSMFRQAGAKYVITDKFAGHNENRHTKPSYVGLGFNLSVEPFNLNVVDQGHRMIAYEL